MGDNSQALQFSRRHILLTCRVGMNRGMTFLPERNWDNGSCRVMVSPAVPNEEWFLSLHTLTTTRGEMLTLCLLQLNYSVLKAFKR